MINRRRKRGESIKMMHLPPSPPLDKQSSGFSSLPEPTPSRGRTCMERFPLINQQYPKLVYSNTFAFLGTALKQRGVNFSSV